jgi:ribonuclease HII
MWKGDRVAGCIAAASVVAKVTRDRIMTRMHSQFPAYDFATHKGYCTKEHQMALDEHGPCPQHRRRFVNVRRAGGYPDGEVDGDWALGELGEQPIQLGLSS